MKTLKDDTDFLALYRSTCAMGASILRSSAALTAKQRKALIADLKSGDEARAKAALTLMGTSESVINEQRRLVSNFASRYPLPKDAAQIRKIVKDAVTAAKLSFSDDAGGGPAPDHIDEITDELDLPRSDGSGGSGGSEGNTACLNGCKAQAAALATAALIANISALAACTALGPFGIVCAVVAIASYALALYEMDAVIDRCVANCG